MNNIKNININDTSNINEALNIDKKISSKKYIKLSQIEHVLHRPNMYIGEIINKKSNEFILENKIEIPTNKSNNKLYTIK